MINENTPLWQLTVGEFLELQNSAAPTVNPEVVEDPYLNSKEARE